jgi:Tol biopolymer transport system component
VSYDAALGRFRPFLRGIAAEGVDFSPDRAWVTYTTFPEGELWRGRVTGRGSRRLTQAPLRAGLPRFSPAGRQIAFAGRSPGGPWRIHIVGADGGEAQVLPPPNVTDPGWIPDGKSIVYSGALDEPAAILLWDLGSGLQKMVPGSEGLFSPRPSPDGRHLAALRKDSMELLILDRSTGRWSQRTDHAVAYPVWTPDGAWLHFRREGANAGFFRIDPVTGREDRVAPLGDGALVGGEWGAWSGLTPEGAPLCLLDLRATRDPPHLGVPVRVDPRGPEGRNTARYVPNTTSSPS